MRQGLSRSVKTFFKAMAPLKNSAVMADHSSHPSHSHCSYEDWAVKHRLSSAAYPQSNGQAELAVKSAKRIISGNTGAQGSLDNDCAARAILQYPSKISDYPLLNCYSTTDYMTLYHPNPHSTSHTQIG